MFFGQIGGHGKPEKAPCKEEFFIMLTSLLMVTMPGKRRILSKTPPGQIINSWTNVTEQDNNIELRLYLPRILVQQKST